MKLETFRIVCEILAEQLSIEISEIKTMDTLGALGADSLDNVEIVMEIEDRFDISFDDSQYPEHDSTIASICENIEQSLP